MCATLKNNPAETTFRQQASPPAGLKRLNRAARFLRRGNAMIMAVSLTVLLAIIGSSFVLMSRLDRQSTRGVEAAALADAAVEAVIAAIQKQLAADMFQANGTLKPDLYDYPGSGANHDHWLASIEPVAETDANGVTTYHWPHISDLQGTGQRLQIDASPWPKDYADADGDGIPDSTLKGVSGLADVSYAVRIIDNCGMVNVTTAWKRDMPGFPPQMNVARTATAADMDSYGEFLHQIDLYRLLNRRGTVPIDPAVVLNEAKAAHLALMKGRDFDTSYSFDLQSILYQDLVIRDYGWFGLVPNFINAGLVRPFGLEDEFELRNRFTINTASQTPLETALWQTVGLWSDANPAGPYRILPYDPAATDPINRWYAHLTGDLVVLSSNDDKKSVPRLQNRHLLTGYSYDRDLRVRDVTNPADDALDRPGLSQFVVGTRTIWPGSPGKFRKVNLNSVLRTLMEQDHQTNNLNDDPTNPLPAATNKVALKADAMRRVALAFAAAGYTWDEGYQFIANLIDYMDDDDVPTVLDPAFVDPAYRLSGEVLPPGARPTVPIYGNERQPFIIAVYNSVNEVGQSVGAGVELFNPYDSDINLTGWEFYYNSDASAAPSTTPLVTLPNSIIRAGQRLVYHYSGAIDSNFDSQHVIDVGSGFTFNPASSNGELILARPLGARRIAVDRVTGNIFQATEGKATASMIWRGAANAPVAPWCWARNEFSPPTEVNKTDPPTPKLGTWPKINANDPLLDKVGISIPIANRGPVWDGTAWRWRVNGWYALSRVLFVGSSDLDTIIAQRNNPDLFEGENWTELGGQIARYDAGTDTITLAQDTNGNGVYDPKPDIRTITEKLTKDRFGNDLYDPATKTCWEGEVRLDPRAYPANKTARLMARISLFSRADDRMDNENEDGDNLPGTNFDTLLECRIPGRINVNTAPKAVLKALFPALRCGDYPNILNEDQLDVLGGWFADAVIWLREPGPAQPDTKRGPFENLADFANRLARFTNVDADGNPVLAGVPQDPVNGSILWFGTMLRTYDPTDTTVVGDPYLYNDSEERDWIFSRMASLLTVRSDTFTAYILIKVQDIERRYIAILDRSNVFLPEIAGRNGSFTDPVTGVALPPPYTDDSGEMAIYDPDGERYGPSALNDPDYFDRQYVTPRVVALRQVPDPR